MLTEKNYHYVSVIELSETKRSTIEVLKTGKIHGRNIEITESMLDEFIANFDANSYGTEVQVNLRHDREGEAAGWIRGLSKKDGSLFAEVEWTPLGVEKIKSRQYKFTSSELAFSYVNSETGAKHKNVLIGVGLTNVPQVKGMSEVTLSEQANLLITNQNNMDKLAEKYKELSGKGSITEAELAEFKKLCDAQMNDENKEEINEMQGKLEKMVKKPEEKPAEKKAELNEKKETTVSLSEYEALKEQNEKHAQEIAELKEKEKFTELKEEVKNTMMLSEESLIGFLKEDIDEVASFMATLDEEQTAKFKELLSKVQAVDLSTKGVTVKRSDANLSKATEDQVIALAEKKHAENPDMDYGQCQKLAAQELGYQA